MNRIVVSSVAALACLVAASGAPSQAPSEAGIPAHLKVKGDPAENLDLGSSRLVAFAQRADPKGPVTSAPYVCLTCKEANQQVAADGAPPPAQLAGAQIGAVRPWLAGLEGEKPVILATPRWTLACVLKEDKVEGLRPEEIARLRAFFPALPEKPARLKAHEMAHLWTERMFAVEGAIAEMLDLTEDWKLRPNAAGYRPLPYARSEIFVFAAKKDVETFANHLLEPRARPLHGSVREHGPLSAVLADDADDHVRRRFVHGAALQVLRRHWRLGDGLPGWIQVGIAHYLERIHVKIPAGRDDLAQTLPPGDESPKDWPQFVRDLVVADKAGQLAALTSQPERALSLRSRIQSWSLVKFLLGADPKRFSVLLNALLNTHPDTPAPQALQDAVKSAYACDLPTLERAWKVWVLKPAGS